AWQTAASRATSCATSASSIDGQTRRQSRTAAARLLKCFFLMSSPSTADLAIAPPVKGKGDPFFIPGDGRVITGLYSVGALQSGTLPPCCVISSLLSALGCSTLRALRARPISALRRTTRQHPPHGPPANNVESARRYSQAT